MFTSLHEGRRQQAFAELDVALNELGPRLDMLLPSHDMGKLLNPLYRFRMSGTQPYSKAGLFHIPFEFRDRVGAMRYSVAGLPCLYLGGSTNVCWRELGQPQIENISVSRFEVVANTDLRVMNLGIRLPWFAGWMHEKFYEFISRSSSVNVLVAAHTACWPLVAICSIRVPDRQSKERPEYLIPQLLLEWVTRTKRFHGIRYFSTHYSEYPDDPKTYMNYVFPALSQGASGVCSELSRMFQLTDPQFWSNAKSLPAGQGKRPIYRTAKVVDQDLENEFGRAEDGLFSLPPGSVV